MVRDTGWFFDTELLVIAERAGLRIHEVPVDWVDDLDSRVNVARTAIDDLKGIVRLGRTLARGELALPTLLDQTRPPDARPAPGHRQAIAARLAWQLLSFTAIGVVSTLAYGLLFLALRNGFGPRAPI